MINKNLPANIFIFFWFFVPLALSAQLNLKIAYVPAYGSFDANNEILSRYNETQSRLEKEFESIHLLHGIELGLRLKNELVGMELSWQNLSKSTEAIGFNSNDQIFTHKLFYGMNSFSAGIELYYNRFGVGSTIDRQKLKIRKNIPGSDTKRTLSNQNIYAQKFYLFFQIQESSSVSLVLKPFVQIPWESYDLSALETELLASNSGGEARQKDWIFGLTIAFYNGPQ